MTTAGDGVLVDCAGARMGGALRLLRELDSYLRARPSHGIRVIGRDRRLTPTWVVRRERPGRYERAVALNNVAFLRTGRERRVLLRNVLHFLAPDDVRGIPGGLPVGIRVDARVVRACAARADAIVVPTNHMADRVRTACPSLSTRLVVRPHPLTAPPPVPAHERTPGQLLCPVVFERFKAMGDVLRTADHAADLVEAHLGTEVTIVVTASVKEAAGEGILDCRHLRFAGRLSPERLEAFQHSSQAVLYPTRIESFGYPLAEARVAGVPVVARDTAQNREVAGPSLIGYERQEVESMAAALQAALSAKLEREAANPFDPGRYFDWLLGRADR